MISDHSSGTNTQRDFFSSTLRIIDPSLYFSCFVLLQVFGALTSCSLHVSDHFYGTGESLLFRFTPRFQSFNWTGDNLYFIKGNNESLAIGAGE